MQSPMEQFTIRPFFENGVHHFHKHDFIFTNQSLWMCIVVGAAALFLTLAAARPQLVPGRLQSLAEITFEFVANMIRQSAGEDGMIFFPFVFTIFVFVLFSNFFGLIPGSFTVTSQIAVTFALACLVIAIVIVTGFVVHGLGFLKLFVPHAPWYLLILLVPIELISFFTRPISLSVRLFANMLAGHTMLKVFASFVIALPTVGLLWTHQGKTVEGSALAALSIAPMLLIVAISALELLVAFLQAYVFAILTCIYLNEALHLHDSH